MIRTIAVERLAASLLTAASLWSAPANAERLLVRLTSVPPIEFLSELNRLVQPITLKAAAGEKAEDLFRRACGGSFTQEYEKLARQAEPTLLKLPHSTPLTVSLPPCIGIKRNVPVAVDPTELLDIVLQRESGARATTMLLQCTLVTPGQPEVCKTQTARQAVNALNSVPDLDAPLQVHALTLPFKSAWAALSLKQGVSIDDAMSKLWDAASRQPPGADLVLLKKGGELELIVPLDTSGDGASPVEEPVATDWPLKLRDTEDAIRDARVFLANEQQRIVRATIRVVDTGFDKVGDPAGFPLSQVATNAKLIRACGQEHLFDCRQEEGGLFGNVVGFNAGGEGDVRTFPGHDERWHGAEVASLALGDRALLQDLPQVAEHLGLNFVRVFKDESDSYFRVDEAALERAVRASPQPTILNVSVGSVQPMELFRAAMATKPTDVLLAVIAAGNVGHDLGRDPFYPAYYGSQGLADGAIIVGAYDPTDTLSSFSNRGKDYVDLLAPGSRVPIQFPGRVTGRSLKGTSFAAPIVSFTAGMLRSFGLDTAARIRTRLQATTRFVSDDISKVVRFGGVLDAAAALRVFDDVVRLRDGKLVAGSWKANETFQICASPDDSDDAAWIHPALLLRVRVEHRDPGQPPRLHIWRRNGAGDPSLHEDDACDPASEDGPAISRVDHDSAPETFKWDAINEFIPAESQYLRRVSAP